jgi:exosortase/archaeosortase family protein
MVNMIAWDKIFYGFCIGTIFAGIDILFLWSHTSKLVGFALVFIPLIVIYLHYTKQKKNSTYASKINLYRCCLGFLLIFIDVAYNLYTGDVFRNFDYGMLSVGFIIVLLNMNIFQFLKLDDEITSFITYFLFIFILLYVSLLMGPNILFGASTNPVFILMIHASAKVSTFFLNFIEPTTIVEGSEGSTIYFSGFRVGLGTACSGVQSITVFLSAILAFFIANREFGIKKTCVFTVVGIGILFFMNVLRIMILAMTGHYISGEAMLFLHTHLGWILFALAMALFWYLVIREK